MESRKINYIFTTKAYMAPELIFKPSYLCQKPLAFTESCFVAEHIKKNNSNTGTWQKKIPSLFFCNLMDLIINFLSSFLAETKNNKEVDDKSQQNSSIGVVEGRGFSSIKFFFICDDILVHSIQLFVGGHKNA